MPRPALVLARLMRIAVPVVILVLLWRVLDGTAILALLGSADLWLLLAALLAVLGQNVLSGLRWRLTATRLGQRIAPRRAVREYFLSQFLNMTLPAGILGDAGRAVRLRGEGGLATSGQAVVIDRLVGQVALFATLLVGLGLASLGEETAWPDWVPTLAIGILAGTVGLVGALALLPRLGSAPGRAAGTVVTSVRASVLARPAWPAQVGYSLAILACNLGAFALCAAATGTLLSALAVVTVLPLILTTMVLPVSVGGWGLREGAAAVLWPVVGAQPEAGIAASICFGLVILAGSLPGALVAVGPGGLRSGA